MPHRMHSNYLKTALVLAAAALIAAPAFSRAKDRPDPAAEKQELANLLSQLHESDSTEIALGKLAQEKGSAPVQAYAKMLVSDHDRADQEIAALAKDEGVELSPPAPENAMEQAQDAKSDQLKSTLQGASGEEFDRRFLETEVSEHAGDIRMLERAMNETGDDRVRKVFGDILPRIEQHHAKAQVLLKNEMGQPTTPNAPGFMPMKPAI